MIRENKGKALASVLLTLLPILIGLLVWNQLPAMMPSHWGFSETPDAYAPKAVMVFGYPIALALLDALMLGISGWKMKKQPQGKQAQALMFWLVPVISIFLSSITYAYALGVSFSVAMAAGLFIGIVLVVIGNLMPKLRMNTIIGIRLPWIYKSEKNWRMTHALAGKVWVACGLMILALLWMPAQIYLWVFFILLLAAILIPSIYSFWLYKTGQAA